MNLGKPPSIPDAHVEIDLHDIAPPVTPACRQSLQDFILELAIIQSAIIDLQLTKSKMKPEALDIKVSEIVRMMDRVWEIIQNVMFLFVSATTTPAANRILSRSLMSFRKEFSTRTCSLKSPWGSSHSTP